jgi:hypothetical protein
MRNQVPMPQTERAFVGQAYWNAQSLAKNSFALPGSNEAQAFKEKDAFSAPDGPENTLAIGKSRMIRLYRRMPAGSLGHCCLPRYSRGRQEKAFR